VAIVCRSLCGPRNHRRADVVAAPDLGKRFISPVAALDRFAPLMRSELSVCALSSRPRQGARASFPGARGLDRARRPVKDG